MDLEESWWTLFVTLRRLTGAFTVVITCLIENFGR